MLGIELVEDHRDFVANLLLNAARRLSPGTEHFSAAYLLAHGVVKIGLVAALLTNQRWAYPVAIIVFAAFIIYQCYRFTMTHARSLIGLSLFDLVVIGLVWLEYQAVKPRGSTRQRSQRTPKVWSLL